MKHSLLFRLLALMCLGVAFSSSAVEPTTGYTEDFTTLYKGYTSGNMSRSSYAYPVRYWMREGVTTKNLNVNTTYNHGTSTVNRCIGYSVANQGTASNQSEVLVTPKVGGEVSFWVHRSSSSATSTYATEIDIFKMTVDASGVWTRTLIGSANGTFTDGIVLEGVDEAKALTGSDYNDLNAWRQVTLKNVPDGTHIGIHINGLWMDDFSATKAWLEWPDYVWDGTIIPYIDVTPLGTTYTKYYLDDQNNLLDENGEPYKLTVQLKQTVNAGKPTEDMFKYRFQFSVTGQDPLRLKDKSGKDIIAEFKERPQSDWTSVSTGDVSHEEVDIEFALYNLDPKYFNTNTSLQAVKVDANGNDVGSPISMQRKNTVAANGTWNATSWSNFQFEALVPQPIIVYSTTTPTATTTASSWKGNTLSEHHPWFINPVSNEAPIYMGNTAGRAEMKITKIEFSDNNFGLKENLTFPLTVGADRVVLVSPSVKATTPGIYKGTMSVYVDGVEQPFVAKLEGAVKPNYETKYLFHNENGTTTPTATMPEGWLATGNWQIATMTVNQQKAEGKWTQAASTYGTTPGVVVLSSPKMTFEEGAEVWFDATCYQLTGAMEVVYSTDRANWQVLKTMTVGPVTPTEENPLTDDMFNSFFTSKSTYNENLFKTYKVEIPQAGEGYIAFRTSSNLARVDNVVIDGTPVEVDFDIAYISEAVPAKFALNKPKEVKVTFRNLLETIAAGEYDIQVVADGDVVRTFSGDKDLTQGKDVELTTTYAFSAPGEHTLNFNLVKGENIVSAAEATVNVVDEGYDEVFQVGPTHTNNMLSDDWNSWPLTPNTNYAITSEAIYPAALLQDINANGASATNNNGSNSAYGFNENAPLTGLKAGDKITSIGWIAYASVAISNVPTAGLPVQLYLENTTDETFANATAQFKEDIEYVYNGTLVFDLTKTNSQRNYATAAAGTLVDMEEPIAKIILDEPFEYTGNNLRVQLRIPKVYFYGTTNPAEDAELFDYTSNGTSIGGQIMALDSKGTNTNDYRILYSSSATNRTVSAQLPMLLMSKETPANKLTGKVTDSKTEEGIAGVTVTAKSEEGVTFTATTGEDGTYTMEVGNPAFDFTVTAEVEHYYKYTSAETVTLAEGDETLDIAMREIAVTVNGVVNDKNGVLEGVTVTLTPADETSETEPMTTTTGADGSYSFKTEAINADYVIKAEAKYYESKEVNVTLGDEDKTVETITLVHQTSTIEGTVVNEDGDAVAGAKVTLTAKTEGAEALTATTGDDGAFELTTEELDTEYTLTIEAEGYVTYTDEVEVGTEDVVLDEIELKFVTVDVTGTVVDEAGKAIADAEVTLTLKGEAEADAEAESLTATTDADGKFTLTTRNLNSDYTITVEAEGYVTYTDDVKVGAEDVALGNIELEKVTVEISGTVVNKDGEPVSGAEVTLTLDEEGSTPMTATTGADGLFTFTVDELNSDYTIAVEAEGYKAYTGTVSVKDADLFLDNIVLEDDDMGGVGAIYFDDITVTPGAGTIEIMAEGVDVVVLNAAGYVIAVYDNLDGYAKVDGLVPGVYIVNKHKVLVK
ncbi:MAG: carboxypeptidase regulatory-like domain-containing protein [Muribaculaceae bacterium]|nr:carboxypeptidase regulatory-like domain-containing protein [Muribaculaceae bacterium]